MKPRRYHTVFALIILSMPVGGGQSEGMDTDFTCAKAEFSGMLGFSLLIGNGNHAIEENCESKE